MIFIKNIPWKEKITRFFLYLFVSFLLLIFFGAIPSKLYFSMMLVAFISSRLSKTIMYAYVAITIYIILSFSALSFIYPKTYNFGSDILTVGLNPQITQIYKITHDSECIKNKCNIQFREVFSPFSFSKCSVSVSPERFEIIVRNNFSICNVNYGETSVVHPRKKFTFDLNNEMPTTIFFNIYSIFLMVACIFVLGNIFNKEVK